MMTEKNTTIELVKGTSIKVGKAIFGVRHLILCALGVLLTIGVIYILYPLLPRTAKPEFYNIGDTSIPSFTQVVGYHKVIHTTQELDGTGRFQAGDYLYTLGETPVEDKTAYYQYLQKELDGVLSQVDENIIILPSDIEDKQIEISLTVEDNHYLVHVSEEKTQNKIDEEQNKEANISRERAKEMLLSLTKEETGFRADISVYTCVLEEEIVMLDDWEYYVFNIIADYTDGRADEHRGTFYVGCHDGILLSYDKETDTAARIR